MRRGGRRIFLICLCLYLLAAGCGRREQDGGAGKSAQERPDRTAASGENVPDAARAGTEPSGADMLPQAEAKQESVGAGDMPYAAGSGLSGADISGGALAENGPAGEGMPDAAQAKNGTSEAEDEASGTEKEAPGAEKGADRGQASLAEEEMPAESIEELETMLLEGRFYYNYSLLSEQEEKRLYLEILCSLRRLDERTRLTAADPGLVEEMFGRVMADHPEIFYVDGFTCTTYSLEGEIVRAAFGGSYTMDIGQIGETRQRLENAAALWLSGVPVQKGDYESVKYLYDYLVTHTEYDLESPDNQNICSVLLNGRSVCQGYARTLQYLCQLLGIPALLVTGELNGEGHAWDLLMLDGEWYYVDPTWGDASYRREERTSSGGELFPAVNYDYFCVTTAQLEQTHTPAEGQMLPVCRAVEDQYYRREGLYLEAADGAVIAAIFARAAAQGQQTVMFQCATDQIYQEVYRLLITEQGVFGLLPAQSRTAAYTHSREQRTFCFWL